MLIWSHLGSPRVSFWSPLGIIRALLGVSEVSFVCAGCGDPRPAPISHYCSHLRALIFYAQAAEIRTLGRLRVTGVLIFYAQVAEIEAGL